MVYTQDNWQTQGEEELLNGFTMYDGDYGAIKEAKLPAVGDEVEYYIVYTVDGETFYENNEGKNYRFTPPDYTYLKDWMLVMRGDVFQSIKPLVETDEQVIFRFLVSDASDFTYLQARETHSQTLYLGDENNDGTIEVNREPVSFEITQTGIYDLSIDLDTQAYTLTLVQSQPFNSAYLGVAFHNTVLSLTDDNVWSGIASMPIVDAYRVHVNVLTRDGDIKTYVMNEPQACCSAEMSGIAQLEWPSWENHFLELEYGVSPYLGKDVNFTLNELTGEFELSLLNLSDNWQRTVVYMQRETVSGQDMFIRGGVDWTYALDVLGTDCGETELAKWLCAVPISHNLFEHDSLRYRDTKLDWYGAQSGQGFSEGSPLVSTTNQWPADWGDAPTIETHGYGVDPENTFGMHYWKLDVDMDCNETVDGWFELKAYVSNGPGWEGDIVHEGRPYASNNHFAQCGKLNVFTFGENEAQIHDL